MRRRKAAAVIDLSNKGGPLLGEITEALCGHRVGEVCMKDSSGDVTAAERLPVNGAPKSVELQLQRRRWRPISAH